MSQPLTEITVRAATEADVVAMLAIYQPIVEHTWISFEERSPTHDEFAARFRLIQASYPWLVAERHGEVAGYAHGSSHRPRPAYRWSVETTVYVAEACRGVGIGGVLYDELLGELARRGFVSVFAGIALPNNASVAIHERCGFRHVGTMPAAGFKRGVWHDLGWWHQQLREPPTTPSEPKLSWHSTVS